MKRLTFILYMSCLFYISYGQQTTSRTFEFPSDLNPASYNEYTARDRSVFNSGTIITPTSFTGNSFIASIDNTLVTPANYATTPVEGSTRSLDTSYEVGSLPGAVNVSSNGAATYGVPIDLPPGVKGMVPGVGVGYNSNSGNGLLGWGWNLSATSAIRRGTTSFMQEGFIEGNDFSTYDRFYLDGNRLILKTGTYGASGST
ncbi:MAG: hypothetical protein MI922_17600, partial [Bacteroidales bacterium]|nr:hypothetical protein [Bacteroidales bacterium]